MTHPAPAPTSALGPPLEREYLTVAQVAGLLQVKAPTIYGWVRDDPSLPAVKIGHTVRFRREALLAWLRAHEQGRPPMRRRLHVAPNSAPGQEAPGG